jgi:hypothetical protein
MLAVKLVILIAFFAKINVVTVLAQNSVGPQVIPGAEICPLQEDRDAARQNLHSTASSVIQRFVNNNAVIARCGPGQWYRVAYLNMSDPTQQCPPSLRLYSANGVRACGRGK